MHRPPPARPIAVALVAGLVCGGIAVTDSAFAGAAAAPEPVDAIAALLGAPQQWFGHDIAAWAADGYRRRPALMVGLAGFALMPLLVVAGMILRRLTRHTARRAHALNAVDVLPRSAWLANARSASVARARSLPGTFSRSSRSCKIALWKSSVMARTETNPAKRESSNSPIQRANSAYDFARCRKA